MNKNDIVEIYSTRRIRSNGLKLILSLPSYVDVYSYPRVYVKSCVLALVSSLAILFR